MIDPKLEKWCEEHREILERLAASVRQTVEQMKQTICQMHQLMTEHNEKLTANPENLRLLCGFVPPAMPDSSAVPKGRPNPAPWTYQAMTMIRPVHQHVQRPPVRRKINP